MKNKFIIVLFITLAGSLSLMAQTKRRTRTTNRKTVQKTVKADTSSTPSVAILPVNNKIDTLKTVKDSDDAYLKSEIMLKARPFVIMEPSANNIQMFHRYKRDIDLKDPKNAKFNTPGSTLIEALLKGIKNGTITPYDATPGTPANPSGDEFTVPLTSNQLMSKLTDTAMVDKLDKDGNKIGSVKQLNDFSADKVVGYRIKEDVYYDKQRGKVETRIIGIAPLATLKLSNGDTIGIQPVCWLRYKQCRLVFAKMDVSDPDRNLFNVSMDDMFLQRQFNAKIVEENNPQGRRIKDYMKDKASQDKEAARIEQKIADYKKSLFSYELSTPSVASSDTKASKTGKKQKSNKPTSATAAAAPVDPTTGTPVKQ